MCIQAGLDEAGRGPWAGSVYAAAVVLPHRHHLPGLTDSKCLSAKQRQTLAQAIQAQALDYAVAFASVEEIDRLNILKASLLAMERAYHALCCPSQVQHALIDGLHCPNLPCLAQAVVRGDQIHPAISAASILAKVSRDADMLFWDQQYPDYGFARHKGYGTAVHREALRRLGPCPIHRRSFRPVKLFSHELATL